MIIDIERTSDEYLVLNSCGIEKFFDRSYDQFRKNGRVDYQLIYVSEGICYLTVNDKLQKVPKGSVILFRPNERQQYSFKCEDKSISYYVHFTGSVCEQILRNLDLYDIDAAYIGKNLIYEKTFEKMLEEYYVKRFAYNECCNAYLLQLFSIAARGMRNNGDGKQNKSRAEEACRRISEKLSFVTVAELADEFHLSVGRFSDIFKDYTGKPPHEYISIMRIAKAKELLLNTDLTIGEIASSVGYYDQNYFSRAFKKIEGVSPRVYRG